MKSVITLNLILFYFIFQSQGQNITLEYGAHGGVNNNTASGSGVSKAYSHALTGFVVGGHVKVNTSKQFGIKAQLQYEQIGWSYKDIVFESNMGSIAEMQDVLFKLNYLNIPILAEYSFGNKIRFHVGSGLFFGILLNNQVITKERAPMPPHQLIITKNKSNFRNPTNFGITGSAGIKIPLSPKIKLGFDAQNNYGLSNIYKSSVSNPTTIKTNSLAILAGLTYSF